MDWFKRYGITGTYFLILLLGWVSILYPCKIQEPQIKILLAVIAFAFLPVGYIITAFQQTIYLSLLKFLWIDRKAKENAGIEFEGNPDDEPTIEVHSTFVWNNEWIKLEYQKHFQEFQRKRMDPLVISLSIIFATIIAFLFSFLCGFILEQKVQILNLNSLIAMIGMNIIIVAIMLRHYFLLWRQVTLMQTLIYIRYRKARL